MVREIAKNHMNVNFHDKNFVIATFFHDYICTAVPARTIHVVAPPTCARGIWLDQRAVSNSGLRSEAFNLSGRPS